MLVGENKENRENSGKMEREKFVEKWNGKNCGKWRKFGENREKFGEIEKTRGKLENRTKFGEIDKIRK